LAIHSIPITIGSETDIIIKYITIQNIRCFTLSLKHINETADISTVVVKRQINILFEYSTTEERRMVANRYVANNVAFFSLHLLNKEKYRNIKAISIATFNTSIVFCIQVGNLIISLLHSQDSALLLRLYISFLWEFFCRCLG
jgi:hypothetical protein